MSDTMFGLFGVSYETVEQEPCVYFIGIFESLLLAKEAQKRIFETTKIAKNDCFIKEITVNTTYDYAWNNSENDVV